ncbi:hypothetical protein SPRG_00781 [Saprolegnia parasitica CBS 223.65]|uniref:Uncharacterized protein n=1 Tax=Saprolegnia parasitica (strain CBS 223.65) TaxID=695850 RepID=A0A067CVM0_SAPPC|nr:hypothetical protein SPRG_00781 [Saprolegnia parasitica CBS 223.65]KDO34719.1 hypothetical protein SPRG_00781 [Saprolegnia parasitica CBS 223.65]|eukprot:XP_012194388.1 hypothetical protein SPRG_00781 [Saprolegnia parasitica CBS 223.65]
MESKRIGIVSIGSRGDVQPYCVLGRALADRGHKVFIATEQRLESLVVDEFRLPFRCIAGDSTGGLFDPKFQAGLAKGSIITTIKMTKEWQGKFKMDDILASYVTALDGADVIVSGGLCMTMSHAIAEKLHAAWVPFILGPTCPTTEFPVWALSSLTCGLRCLNKWTYTVLFKKLWKDEQHYINPWRTNVLGLAPITMPLGMLDIINSNERIPVLIACSALFCGPQARIPSDYDPRKIHLLGPVFAAPSPLPEAATSFLNAARAAGTPVIYLGFGSMPTADPIGLLRLAVDVCERVGCRAIVVAGWSALTSDEADALLTANQTRLLVLRSVSHGALFPKVDCIVHHAGIGTCNASLASGTPQVPCPVMLDQPHNAKVLVRLGVAPCALPFGKLSAPALARALQDVLANVKDIQARAKTIGDSLRDECADALEQYMQLITTAESLSVAAS